MSPQPLEPATPPVRLRDDFASLTDPRRCKVTLPLANLVTIAVRGGDDFTVTDPRRRTRRDWLATAFDLSAASPPLRPL